MHLNDVACFVGFYDDMITHLHREWIRIVDKLMQVIVNHNGEMLVCGIFCL